MYKVVISDLDGTLLNEKHYLSDFTKEAIQKIVKQGYKFLIATGRHHIDASKIQKELNLDTILISSNGARVHDAKGNELFARNLEEEVVRIILNFQLDDDIHINMYQGNHWFVERENEEIKAYNEKSGFFYEVKDLKSLPPRNVSKIFFASWNHEKLVQLQDKINKYFQNSLNVTFSFPQCLEVMPNNISKRSAIEAVLEKDSISAEQCIAFGDGLNDLEMLQFVGKGLIMKNAHDKLKELLRGHEVIKGNYEDGVAKYLIEKLV